MRYPLLMVLAVSACGAVPDRLDGPQATSDGLLGAEVSEVLPFVDVTIRGVTFRARTPEPVRIRQAPVCDAAAVVLADGLGIPVACSAVGTLTMALVSTDPDLHLAAFLRAVKGAGVAVEVSRTGLVLKGGGEREEGRGTDAPGAGPGTDGAILDTLPVEEVNTVLDALISAPERVVRVAGPNDPEGVARLRDSLGLPVDVVPTTAGVLLVGELVDVALLDSAAADIENTALALPIVVPPETAEVLGDRFGVSFVTLGDTSVAVGPASAVRDAARAIQSVAPTGSTVRLRFWLVAVSDRSVTQIGADLPSRFGSVEDFDVQLRAARSSEWADVIAAPSLLATDGQAVAFSAGSEVAFAGAIDDQGRQQTEFRDIGLAVQAVPRVGAGRVTVALDLEASEPGAGSEALVKRTLTATVVLVPGEVVEVAALGLERAASGQTWGFSSDRSALAETETVRILATAEFR